ncbi:MAG TPA: reverse transcriptase domain-containing protein, partial [Ktedonobacteraceae bacterium]|nr:reverse transcriptase domain-containing protein [Ktedonobacteraceae bacterium]
METALAEAYRPKEGKPNFVRYADDFVVVHPTEEGIVKAKAVLEAWIKDMGLEMKPSKTRITHTLQEYQGTRGFDFLGWTVRQFPVGKTHSGKLHQRPLGFKTIINVPRSNTWPFSDRYSGSWPHLVNPLACLMKKRRTERKRLFGRNCARY